MPENRANDVNAQNAELQSSGVAAGSNSGSAEQPDLPEQFQFIEKLGQGGMGVVYKARNKYTNAIVAIKMIKDAEQQSSDIQRFKREAQAASAFRHPNAVSILDFGVHNETPYLVMEYLTGVSLDSYLKQQGVLDDSTTLTIAIDVCHALIKAHEAGVVHRDLKPSNIILDTSEKDGFIARVLDFGLARITNLNESQKLTQTGEVLGTPLYMSPEQFTGQPADSRSDLYSLGAVLYQCLTGRPPHQGETAYSTMYKRLNEKPQSINSQKHKSALESIVLKCLEVDPVDRYQSTVDLLADLVKVAQGKAICLRRGRLKLRSKYSISPIVAATIVTGVIGISLLAGLLLKAQEDLSPVRPQKPNGKTLAELNQQIERNPSLADAYYERGLFHYERDERTNAIDDFSTTLKIDPNFAEAYAHRCEMSLLLSRFDEALSDANKAIALYPNWCDAYSRRARVELFQEQYHASMADAMKALSVQYWDPACNTLTEDYRDLGSMDKALYCANHAVEKSSSWSSDDPNQLFYAYMHRGWVYLEAHQLDAAEKDLQAAVHIHHEDSFAWGLLAQVYAYKHDQKNAEDAIKRCLAFDLFPARAQRLRGDKFRADGDWKAAAEAYSSSTSLESWYAPAYTQRAIAELAQGAAKSAELDLEHAVSLSPTSALAHSYLALAEDQLQDQSTQAALPVEQHLQAALALTPDLPMTFVNRARIRLNHGESLRALEDCNHAIHLNHYLSDAYATRALALKQLQNDAEADKDQKTAKLLGWHEFALKEPYHEKPTEATSLEIYRPDVSKLDPDTSLTLPDHVTALQQWALACGAVLTEQPDWQAFPYHEALLIWPNNPNFIDQAKEKLKTFDGVTDKQSLEAFISSLKQHADSSDKQTKAFNYVRIIARGRMGYLAGYLTAEEAWGYILPAAQSIHDNFTSWSDLADCYVAARSAFHHGAPPGGDLFVNSAHEIADRLTKTVPFAPPGGT